MTPQEFYDDIQAPMMEKVRDILAFPLRSSFWSPESDLQMLATAGVESYWADVQQANGPARGPWQMQENTLGLLLTNPVSSAMLKKLCAALDIMPYASAIYANLLISGTIAAGTSRLDYLCNPNPFPELGKMVAAYDYYVDTWNPGKPSFMRWTETYPQALAVIKGVYKIG